MLFSEASDADLISEMKKRKLQTTNENTIHKVGCMHWSIDENERLVTIAKTTRVAPGENPWYQISAFVQSRTAIACRRRWTVMFPDWRNVDFHLPTEDAFPELKVELMFEEEEAACHYGLMALEKYDEGSDLKHPWLCSRLVLGGRAINYAFDEFSIDFTKCTEEYVMHEKQATITSYMLTEKRRACGNSAKSVYDKSCVEELAVRGPDAEGSGCVFAC